MVAAPVRVHPWTDDNEEDPTEFGADASDMEQAAKVSLLMIAERLALALFEEAADDEPEGDDDE